MGEISIAGITSHQMAFLALLYISQNLVNGPKDVTSQTVVENTWILIS